MAWTAPKTWSVGEVLTAANMNLHLRDNFLSMGPHLIARRTSDQSVTSSTVLVDDNTLVLPVLANEVWKAEWHLRIVGGSTGDYKCGFTFPTAGEVGVNFAYVDAAAAQQIEQNAYTTSPTTAFTVNITATTFLSLNIRTLYVGGANAGDVKIQFAQATSNATPTTHKINSTLWAVKLA